MNNNLTQDLISVVNAAHKEALARHNQQITCFHILMALLKSNHYIVNNCFKILDISKLKSLCESKLSSINEVYGTDQISFDRNFSALFFKMETEAQKNGDKFISLDVLILCLCSNEPVNLIFAQAGGNLENLRKKLGEMRMNQKVNTDNAESQFDALNRYTKDITALANESKLDPVIGRDEEIRRTIQILSRRTKNNPILIGEPGVGKTAIVEGLAGRIIKNDVPESIKNKKIMSLDLGMLIAGAKFRGEFEERLKALLNEISKSDDIVLFIDEIHMLMGAGQTDSALDASNMLKPALSRGELHCIGSTTLDEYRKYIEKDSAFARRFQPVFVGEPSIIDSISILRGLKEKYELHHGIRISDSAVIAACRYSDRYISDRFLPDKAIDLMDEAASRLRMVIDSKPEEIDELDRKIMQLKIEQEVLKKETDEASCERLKKIQNELKILEEDSKKLNGAWQSEKKNIDEIKKLKNDLDEAKNIAELAQRSGDLARAGELLYSKIPQIQKNLNELQKLEGQKRNEVTAEDIAIVVSRWTGIPVEKMVVSEKDRLLNIEKELKNSVVGQGQAIKSVSDCIIRSRAGISDPNKPIGSFLFLGPTGVGKTELAKALAQFLFDDRNNIVRIDMSEYMEKHSVSRLIGAPPGYVGYEQGGELTGAVKRRPYSVLLFDEVEKAHNDVFNVFLQILDEGHLTDGLGRNVNFKNTIIILTSNLGAEYFLEKNLSKDVINSNIMHMVRSHFKPEFLNRLDDIVIFNSLREENIRKIVDLQLRILLERLSEKNISIEFSSDAKNWLATKGYNTVYGARPLKRCIQKYISDEVAYKMISGEIKDGQKLKCVIENDKIKFK